MCGTGLSPAALGSPSNGLPVPALPVDAIYICPDGNRRPSIQHSGSRSRLKEACSGLFQKDFIQKSYISAYRKLYMSQTSQIPVRTIAFCSHSDDIIPIHRVLETLFFYFVTYMSFSVRICNFYSKSPLRLLTQEPYKRTGCGNGMRITAKSFLY